MGRRNFEVNLIGMSYFKPPYTDDDELLTYPERRLWSAVILAAVEEYKDWLIRIESAWNFRNQPVNRDFFLALETIRKECRSKWFADICEMADISPDHIIRKFDQLDREYCVKAIPQTDSPVPVISRWRVRKAHARRIIKVS